MSDVYMITEVNLSIDYPKFRRMTDKAGFVNRYEL